MLGTVELIIIGVFMDVVSKTTEAGEEFRSKIESFDYEDAFMKAIDLIPPVKKYRVGRQFNKALENYTEREWDDVEETLEALEELHDVCERC